MRLRRLIAFAASFLPNGLTSAVYRHVLGAKVGRGVSFGIGSTVVADDQEIGDGVVIGRLTQIRAVRCRLGVRSMIGPRCHAHVRELDLDSRARLASEVHVIGALTNPDAIARLGKRAWIFDWTYINVDRPVLIGKNAGVGGQSCIFAHGSWLSQLDGYPVTHAPVTVQDNVWLPWGCFLLPGVTVGEGSVIGARSVINKDVPPFALAAGIPAKVLRPDVRKSLTDDERIAILRDITTDFSHFSGVSWEAKPLGNGLVISRENRAVVRVHRDLAGACEVGAAPAPGDGVLHVFLKSPSELPTGVAWFALDEKSSSPEQTFSSEARAWLEHATRFGVRYYPNDE